MKVYCINLDDRPDRLAHMTQQFAAQGMSFERVSAVDGREPAVTAAAERCLPGSGGHRISAGAYGCFQSHREVWRRLLASEESHAMVFEDDLVLAGGISAYLDPAWVPQDADLVKLETYLVRIHRDGGRGNAAFGRRLHRLRSRHLGTGCYVIARAAAGRLLALTQSIADPIDQTLFNQHSAIFRQLAIYQMVPAPVIQGRFLDSAGPGWAQSSIMNKAPRARAKGGEGGWETPLAQWRRRLIEEMRGLRTGQRYVVVPFG